MFQFINGDLTQVMPAMDGSIATTTAGEVISCTNKRIIVFDGAVTLQINEAGTTMTWAAHKELGVENIASVKITEADINYMLV